MKIMTSLILVVAIAAMSLLGSPLPGDKKTKEEASGKVAVLWTSGDIEVATKVVVPYVFNSKKLGWWKTVRLIVWGPSAKLLSENKELQEQIKKMKEIGIELYACKWCADQYNVSFTLKKLGVEVIYYGKPLSEHLKSDWKVITF